jgi:hypothetical protein
MLQRGKKFACVADTQVILKENLKEIKAKLFVFNLVGNLERWE